MGKQLVRSKNNRVISGVCGGIAEYFQVDATLIRLLWIIVSLSFGIGVAAYIICLIIFPEEYGVTSGGGINLTKSDAGDSTSENNKILAGVILIALGAIIFAKKYLTWIHFGSLWPIFLIVGGVYLIYKEKRGK